MRAGVSPEPPGRKRLAGQRQRPGYASRASRQHAEVALPRHRLRAERPQERTIPLRVDRHAARLGESGRQVGDRTTLDLLNAENDAASAELALLQARVAFLMDRLRLSVGNG